MTSIVPKPPAALSSKMKMRGRGRFPDRSPGFPLLAQRYWLKQLYAQDLATHSSPKMTRCYARGSGVQQPGSVVEVRVMMRGEERRVDLTLTA